MKTTRLRTLLKAAATAGALSALASCAHNANSDLAYDSLAASDTNTSIVDLGYAAAARGDHARAIQYFRSAHAKNLAYGDSNNNALVGLGQSLLAIGQNADAAKVFAKAAKSGGGSPALRGLSQAQLYLQQPGLAVESARRAVQLDPSDAKAMGILGVALDVLGDHQGAASIYADAMVQFPGSLNLASNHGLSMVMTGDIEQGTRLLEDVVRDPRATARDRQNLALAYALGGDFDKGAALAAIDLDVSGVKANLLYADMLRAMSPKARLAALVTGTQAPKTDKMQNANAVFLKGDNAAWVDASIRRLVPVEGSADLAGVPPLMDPTGWAVQIAAYRKLEHLAPGWAYLSSKYASIIGGLEPRRSEVNHPPAAKGPVGFFYRLNAGPLRTKQEAVDICTRMTARGAECWVRPPTAGEGRLPKDELAAGNAAESAMIASGDYNAVVNQFARAMVMKSRKAAPASTRELPPIMTAQAKAQPPAAAPAAKASATQTLAQAAPLPTAAKKTMPSERLLASVPVLSPKPRPSTVIPSRDELKVLAAAKQEAEAIKTVPTLAAYERPSTVKPSREELEALAAARAQAEIQAGTQAETQSPAAIIQAASNMAPSTDGMTAPVSEQQAAALSQVFDAVEEAENSAPKFDKDPAYDEGTSNEQAPSPGKIIPAMTQFGGTPKSQALIQTSGTLRPVLQNSGVVHDQSANGVNKGVY